MPPRFGPQVDGKNLTEIINERHENVKYLPGISLPENVVAVSSAVQAAAGADLLIFVLPHQVRAVRVAMVTDMPSHIALPFLSHRSSFRACAKSSRERWPRTQRQSP